MAQTDSSKNERLALLLGWEDSGIDNIRTGARLWGRGIKDWDARPLTGGEVTQDIPNVFAWERFPDLQAFIHDYIEGMERPNEAPILLAVQERITGPFVLYGTPEIFGDAILEVCDA